VVNRTVDGDVEQDVHAERDVDPAAPDLMVSRQLAARVQSDAHGPLPPKVVASHQIVAGDIPVEPPGFRPRVGLLAELDRAGARVSVIHAVTGRRGLGTTQLAAAYARARLEAGWRLVAWVNGTDTGSLLAGLAAVADATGLTHDDSGRRITGAAAAVRRWLESDGDRCLLVFDDVSDPQVLQEFVPAHGKARVLIISTRQSARDLGSAVPVDVFSTAEASGFLARRTGLDDEVGAAAVAAVLGHLPLSLALAAPVIAGQHVGYAGFLDRLRATSADVSLTRDEQAWPPSLARTVLLSLQAVRTADPTGICIRVMEIMAVLSAAGVHRELLYAAGQAGLLATGRHRVEARMVDRVLEWLSDRSLLTFSLDGQTVILHRSVAEAIRNELHRRQMLTAVCEAAAFVLDLYSRALVGSADRRTVRGIPQQVTALLGGLAGSVTEVDEELAWLLLRLRFVAFYHLIELGDSTLQAIAVGEPLAEDLDRLLGPDHPDTLNSRNSLAAAYLAAGRVAEAIPLLEQTLAMRQRMLGPDDPETLTSQNNLASAYQDEGRTAEAIRLYELNLEVRERLLGPDHPSTLNSQGNLAAAYRDAGRVAEAISLLEQTLAVRERVLGPDHPDTRTSRKSLARAYQDAGRAAEAAPLLERILADREGVLGPEYRDTRTSQEKLDGDYQVAGRAADAYPPAGQALDATEGQRTDRAAGRTLPADFRRPPADSARRVLPSGLRRPPADPVRQPFPTDVARAPAKLADHSTSQMQARAKDDQYDSEVVAAIAAEDPAGIAMAYDRYAAGLYGYCHWVLHESAPAAEALKDTFVVAAATLGHLSAPSTLRPWLFALARSECRRRVRPMSAASDEETDAVGPAADATHEPSDATVQFSAVGQVPDATREPSDATMPLRVISLPTDATMPFRIVSQPTHSLAYANGDRGQAELRSMIHSILAGLKSREREVIELSFRHSLYDNDLALALGASSSRTHALASRARSRVEEALSALHIAFTRREACPVLGELLADWDGQLTEETRDLVSWHIKECQTCAHHGWGALRPAAFSRLLPLAPLPLELREQVLSVCTSAAADAVAYRRRVVRRAESIWFARFSQAIRQVSWANIRAHPGVSIAATAVVVWVMAAVSVTLLTFAGSHAAHAPAARPTDPRTAQSQATQTRVGTSVRSPAAAQGAATAPTSTAVAPSPAVTQPSVYVSTPVQPSPSARASPSVQASASPLRSASSSSKPSPSPSRSASSSSKPSPSSSPSPSRSASSLPSSSPSPTA
jgi:RNA polymerase sigma factor (sigma-70 family)